MNALHVIKRSRGVFKSPRFMKKEEGIAPILSLLLAHGVAALCCRRYEAEGSVAEVMKLELRRKLFWCLLAIGVFFPQWACAQNTADTLRLVQTLPFSATNAAVDNLSNVYLITPGNAIEKYAPDGRRLARYTNNRLGKASLLDVSNPLKVLVWYADFRIAVFLDRSLTELGELNLITAGYPEVRTVAAAQDGNMWLYDEVNFRLVKITPSGEKRHESQSMNLLEPTPNRPSCLQEGNDRVWMADSIQGVFAFDFFAQFDRAYKPQQPVTEFQIVDNQMHYLSGNKIIEAHLLVRLSREVAINPEILSGKPAMLSGGKLVVLGKADTKVYDY